MLSTLLKASLSTEEEVISPQFVSASNVGTAGDQSVAVPAPANIQNFDVLIAIGYLGSVNDSITLPTGFTSVYSELTSSPSIRIGYKIAAGESGSYTFSYGVDQENQSIILVYRNVAYNTVGAINRASAATTATANAMTSPAAGINIYSFTSTAGEVSTGVAGATKRVDSSGNIRLAIYDELAPTPISANKTMTWTASSVVSGIQINLAG